MYMKEMIPVISTLQNLVALADTFDINLVDIVSLFYRVADKTASETSAGCCFRNFPSALCAVCASSVQKFYLRDLVIHQSAC